MAMEKTGYQTEREINGFLLGKLAKGTLDEFVTSINFPETDWKLIKDKFIEGLKVSTKGVSAISEWIQENPAISAFIAAEYGPRVLAVFTGKSVSDIEEWIRKNDPKGWKEIKNRPKGAVGKILSKFGVNPKAAGWLVFAWILFKWRGELGGLYGGLTNTSPNEQAEILPEYDPFTGENAEGEVDPSQKPGWLWRKLGITKNQGGPVDMRAKFYSNGGEAEGWAAEGQKYAEANKDVADLSIYKNAASTALDFVPIIGDVKGMIELVPELQKAI